MSVLAGLDARIRLLRVYDTLNTHLTDATFSGTSSLAQRRRRLQTWLWEPSRPIEPLPGPVRLRLLLQDLGPTYVKIGQMISSRGHSLPAEWDAELAKLQSDVRPVSYGEIEDVVVAELGAHPQELYAEFDREPLAAASLAQVHRVVGHDGRRAVAKVQRPAIHRQLESDVRILRRLSAALQRRAFWAEDIDLAGMIAEFGSTLLRELDYRYEAYNARRLAATLAPIDGLHVPDVDYERSTARVLTLEFIDGVKPTETAAIDAAGLDRTELADRLIRGAVKMLLMDGFFHADPHPGNVKVELESGRVTFLDTGMVGELSVSQRVAIGGLLLAFRSGDVRGIVAAMKPLTTPYREVDDMRLVTDFERRVGPYLDPPPGQTVPVVAGVIPTAMDVMRDAGYRVDPQLTLALKALVQAEAITSALAPEWTGNQFLERSIDAVADQLPDVLTSDAIVQEVTRQATSVAGEAVRRLPSIQRGALSWLDRLEQGRVVVDVDTSRLDPQVERLQRAAQLATAGILIAGLAIAAALAAGVESDSFLAPIADYALALLAFTGVVGAVTVLGLLWSLFRRPRRRPD